MSSKGLKKTEIMDVDKYKENSVIASDVNNFEYLEARIEANGKLTPEIRRPAMAGSKPER